MIVIGIVKIEQGDELHLANCLKKLPAFMQEKISGYPRQDEQLRSVSLGLTPFGRASKARLPCRLPRDLSFQNSLAEEDDM